MQQVPQVIVADQLATWDVSTNVTHKGEEVYVMARPMSCGGVWTRLKLAFGVFTGKYDALKWIEQ